MNLLKKYSIKYIKDLISNKKEVEKIIDFVKNYKNQEKRSLIINGPTGSGKTSIVYAISNDLNLEILELNSSDFRDENSIKSIIGNASKQQSLFFKSKIILLDEIEGIYGVNDRGFYPTISEIIDNTAFPIILTTSDLNEEKLKDIKKKSVCINLNPATNQEQFLFLKDIILKEKIKATDSQLIDLINLNNGDIRALLIDLELITINNKINQDLLEILNNVRNKKETIINGLNKLFSSNNLKLNSELINNFDVEIADISKINKSPIVFSNEDALFYWLEENLPKINPKELNYIINLLSKSEVNKGRIIKTQYWRLLIYINALVAASTLMKEYNEQKLSLTFRSPKQNFRLWSLISKRKTIILKKISNRTHTSISRTNKDIYPYLKIIARNNNEEIIKELDLNIEDIAYLSK
ncbi:AAA family ATPase [Candidatus Woesearchaeota archaeon]|nr:AAA family ATPase [Candidatus Woesearchaeota archaeon]